MYGSYQSPKSSRISDLLKYKYLRTSLEQPGDEITEIKTRIEMARSSFMRTRNFLCNGDVKLDLQMRIVCCRIFFVFLYRVVA